jgi:predicted permease
LTDILQLFSSNLLPIILVAGIGFALQKLIAIDPQPISQLVFYALSPALVFGLLTASEISINEIMRMVSLAAFNIVIIAILCYVIGRSQKLDGTLLSALIITSSFMNAGNYGLPLARLTLGESGLAWASIYFVTSNMMINSLGVYVASVGRQSPSKALFGLFKVPSVYAIPLALIVRSNGIELPTFITEPIDMLGSGSIPVMLILLGIQIGRLNTFNHKKLLSQTVALRLIISPIVAWLIAPLFKLDSVGQIAAIIQAGMPAAVYNIVIATKFDVEPEFVAGALVATSLISPLTVTAILVALGV